MNTGTCRNQVDDGASNSPGRKSVRVRIPPSPLRRWNEIEFAEAVATSYSVAQVLKSLKLNATGSNYLTVHKYVKLLGLNISHWTGITTNRGLNHKGGFEKIPWQEILVLDRHNGLKTHIRQLRRALIESGVEEKCSECGLSSIWNGKSLRLQIDHENGNPLDNRPGNPRFLCPNCHSQTPTHGCLNIGRVRFPLLAPKYA
jgi:predicted RNA-binding Zn-ribbon protein involved in translation (DUF1610 family)